MGMMSSPCARSHASAICPAVALYFLPSSASPSESFKMFGKFSAWYRGTVLLQSFSDRSLKLRYRANTNTYQYMTTAGDAYNMYKHIFL